MKEYNWPILTPNTHVHRGLSITTKVLAVNTAIGDLPAKTITGDLCYMRHHYSPNSAIFVTIGALIKTMSNLFECRQL